MARKNGDTGAPTGQWETIPQHLKDASSDLDIRKAQARLIVRRPSVPEVEIPIEKTEFVIGRHASEVDLVLDDELVSRRHAKLTMDARGYFRLEDLGSQNGLRYEGRPVRRLNLVDGDKFQIGKTEFEFHAMMTRFSGSPPAKGTPQRAGSMMVEPPTPRAGGAAPEDLETSMGDAADQEDES